MLFFYFTNANLRKFIINQRIQRFCKESTLLEKKTLIIRNYTKLEEHDSEVVAVIVGNLLGDGHLKITRQSGGLAFVFSKKHIEYAQYFHTFFSLRGYSKTNPFVCKKNKVKTKFYETIRFGTFFFKSFIPLHHMFYREATLHDRVSGRGTERFIKIIPKNIENFLTAQSLAIWFMDDGTFLKKEQIVHFSTHCFMKEEVEFLQQTLQKKFNLTFLVYRASRGKSGKEQYVLTLSRKQLFSFIQLVKPFMIPSMYYKLGLNLKGDSMFEQKFYIKKVLDELNNLSPQIFALWVSKCASFDKKKKSIRLSVDRALETEVKLIQNTLQIKFDLRFTIQKEYRNNTTYHRLYLSPHYVSKLQIIVIPYMSSQSIYKIGL
jgi:hypothetical protein